MNDLIPYPLAWLSDPYFQRVMATPLRRGHVTEWRSLDGLQIWKIQVFPAKEIAVGGNGGKADGKASSGHD